MDAVARMSTSAVPSTPAVSLSEAGSRHTIPVIDRMMDLLAVLEHRPGASITTITGELGLPRTTVYRILNTLQAHDVVRRDAEGGYWLGRRLLMLASHVLEEGDVSIAAVAQPFLDRIATELGNSVKLSVLDSESVLVIAVAQGKRDYALTVTVGQRMPIHAGAAGKLLFAHAGREQQDAWLARPLHVFTSRTITDPKRLRAEASRIRRVGWAQDRGESSPSIFAFAAPVWDRSGRVAAALSLPFLLGTEPSRMEVLRTATIDTAWQISAALQT
jgi:DNA-binding IclR family transcriptional regulator